MVGAGAGDDERPPNWRKLVWLPPLVTPVVRRQVAVGCPISCRAATRGSITDTGWLHCYRHGLHDPRRQKFEVHIVATSLANDSSSAGVVAP
jgi:hypothetical protein